MTEINPKFLVLPQGKPALRDLLRAKVQDYHRRKAGAGKTWENLTDPEKHAHPDFRAPYYKHLVLSRVLLGTPVDTNALAAKLAADPDIQFSEDDFANACGVIEAYLMENHEGMLKGGTGLT